MGRRQLGYPQFTTRRPVRATRRQRNVIHLGEAAKPCRTTTTSDELRCFDSISSQNPSDFHYLQFNWRGKTCKNLGFSRSLRVPALPWLKEKGSKHRHLVPVSWLSGLRSGQLNCDYDGVGSKPGSIRKLGCFCRWGDFSQRSQQVWCGLARGGQLGPLAASHSQSKPVGPRSLQGLVQIVTPRLAAGRLASKRVPVTCGLEYQVLSVELFPALWLFSGLGLL
jgi:hypothetical protein